jgi:hypothetical protein
MDVMTYSGNGIYDPRQRMDSSTVTYAPLPIDVVHAARASRQANKPHSNKSNGIKHEEALSICDMDDELSCCVARRDIEL